MARHGVSGDHDRDSAKPRNHAWLVWTVSVAAYVALMLGALVLTAGFPI